MDLKPWENEPNAAYWLDNETGFNCQILRSQAGHLCGYVGVPFGHVLYEKEYNREKFPEEYYLFSNLEVHSGITWTSKRSFEELARLLLITDDQMQELGHLVSLYWIGFDCGHGCDGDYSPFHEALVEAAVAGMGLPKIENPIKQTYKEFAYVQQHVLNLAKQLKEIDIY